MKITKHHLLAVVIAFLSVTMYSCKAKKLVAKPTPPPAVKETPPVKEEPVKEEPKPEPVAQPDFNFQNIQFEFNSDVLKTSAYPILDKAAAEMKKDPSTSFILNGHSSAEGTAARNLSLSVDRANSVKSYLVNAGLSASKFEVKGYGESMPITSNDTEAGKVKNRRVEIKLAN